MKNLIAFAQRFCYFICWVEGEAYFSLVEVKWKNNNFVK